MSTCKKMTRLNVNVSHDVIQLCDTIRSCLLAAEKLINRHEYMTDRLRDMRVCDAHELHLQLSADLDNLQNMLAVIRDHVSRIVELNEGQN